MTTPANVQSHHRAVAPFAGGERRTCLCQYINAPPQRRQIPIVPAQTRHYLKPPKFDGSTAFETFYAHFVNCAKYNMWNRHEQLAHLKAALTDEAGQVLWDIRPEITESFNKLVALLKEWYGGASMSDKYRMEVSSRARRPGESLQELHRDICRLMALAYPDLDTTARGIIAIDYFVESMGDANLILKIRECDPKLLDEALRVALKQEIWMKDVAHFRSNGTAHTRQTRAIDTYNTSLLQMHHRRCRSRHYLRRPKCHHH